MRITTRVTRRGKGGAVREPVAGLTVARFHHHTSRDLDPQLHSHAFVFNLAPRRDGSWGTLVSRELYKAQKETGAVYRAHLANALEREGHAVERRGAGFRLKAIPHHVERAFSKRRQAIEQAAETHGYRTPKGMELAALRTRKAKRPRERAALFEAWKQEARTLGFDLQQARRQQGLAQQQHQKPGPTPRHGPETEAEKALASAQRLLTAIAMTAGSRSGGGLQVRLRSGAIMIDSEPSHERD